MVDLGEIGIFKSLAISSKFIQRLIDSDENCTSKGSVVNSRA